MKSNKQILQDKPQMDLEQQECLRTFTIPKSWMVAPELNIFFDELNTSIFHGVLPKVPCYWSTPVRSFLGRCHSRIHPKTKNRHSVAIEIPCNHPDGTVYDTMIHEMVHVYQTVMNVPLNHNRLFHSINKSKRVTYLHQKKGTVEPLLYPPRYIKKNKMWSRAHDIEVQLQELSELLFEKAVPIPTCWWHSTKTRTLYTLEPYWCHVEQSSKPNTLELSKKVFSPTESDLIYILCTIKSWKANGHPRQREYRKDLFERKKEEYFGPPKTYDLSCGQTKQNQTRDEIFESIFQKFAQDRVQGKYYTPRFIVNAFIKGTVSSGKSNVSHNIFKTLHKEKT